MRIAVLGGGVAGVVLARELSRTPTFQVDLLERSPELGGLHRSVQVEGAWYDIGAFLFGGDHALLRTFPTLYDSFVPINHRGISLTHGQTLDVYPLSIRGYVRDNGVARFLADLADLLRCKYRFRRRDSLASYMRYYLGEGLYRRSGLKNYIERLYAVADTEVDLEFALQRIPSLAQECGLRHNVRRLLRELSHDPRTGEGWMCYVRPHNGFRQAYRVIESELQVNRVTVRTGSMMESVEKRGNTFVVRFVDAPPERYDLVISTIPVGTMMHLIGRTIPLVPETMNLISLCYRFRGELGFEKGNMLFNFTRDGDWKRITFFSSYYGLLDGEHYFVAECTARRRDPRDAEYMRHSFEEHIGRSRLLKGDLKFQGAVVTENAYPFFRRNDIGSIEEARRTLQGFGLLLAGRQGRFVYTDSNVTAAVSRDVARELRARYGGPETV